MTDTEILEEVYRRLVDEKEKYRTALPSPIIDFIEQEWQKRDEAEADTDEMMDCAESIFGGTTFSKHWYGRDKKR
jgi:hypothetical protein